jgi:DNA-binding Lrp family transcriptional regulator
MTEQVKFFTAYDWAYDLTGDFYLGSILCYIISFIVGFKKNEPYIITRDVANFMKISPITVKRSIKQLEEMGIISVRTQYFPSKRFVTIVHQEVLTRIGKGVIEEPRVESTPTHSQEVSTPKPIAVEAPSINLTGSAVLGAIGKLTGREIVLTPLIRRELSGFNGCRLYKEHLVDGINDTSTELTDSDYIKYVGYYYNQKLRNNGHITPTEIHSLEDVKEFISSIGENQ